MWECKGKPSLQKDNWDKFCDVEICPMEHWVNSVINGAEWELWVSSGCENCPLRLLNRGDV